MAVVFVARRCDLRVGIIDYFDLEVKPIQQEYKKPRKIFSGVWWRAVAHFARFCRLLSSMLQ